MKLIRFLAIVFFDIIDKYFHQVKILNFLKKNKVTIRSFFDIGAHNGTYTDLIKNNFQVKNIYMFEPQKNVYNYIKKKYKNDKRVKIFNCAVSDTIKDQKLKINLHDLTTSLTESNKSNSYLEYKAKLFDSTLENMVSEIYSVKSLKLSSILKQKSINTIDFLKIDTEGHELQVLNGMGTHIRKVRYLLIEFHIDNIYLNYNPKKIHSYLIKNNFILKKTLKFPFTTWEDRFYLNRNTK